MTTMKVNSTSNFSNTLTHKQFSLKKFHKNFACADTETDSTGQAVIFSIVGYDRKNNYQEIVIENHNHIEIKQEIKEILNTFSVVYFHNLEYDLNAIFGKNWVEKHTNIFRQSGCLISKFNKTKLLDSLAILPKSLAKIGEIIGEQKTQINGKFLNKKYCLNDSRILFKSVTKFFEILKQNKIPFGYTLPSIFINFLRTKLTTKVQRQTLKECAFIRKAYKGGITEVFVWGKVEKEVNVYDINSLYPFAMKEIKLAIPSSGTKTKTLKKDEEKYQILAAKVQVYNDCFIPCLGIKRDNKLLFPVGIFFGHFTNLELNYLEQNNLGRVLKIYGGFEYDYYKNNFLSDVVDELYSLRVNAKSAIENYVFKIILNGGYGKFGQWVYKPIYNESENVIEQIKTEDLKAFANQIWAIQVTAFARLYLHKFLLKYSENILYCDTDSLHLTCKLNAKYIGKELGKFKHEMTTQSAQYKAPKFYRIGEQYRVKGVPKNRQIWAFKNNVVYYLKPTKIKSALRYNYDVNIWKGQIKKLQACTNKRLVDGQTTRPIELKKACKNEKN